MTDTLLLRADLLPATWLAVLVLAACGDHSDAPAAKAGKAATCAPAAGTAPRNPLETLVQSHRERAGASQADAEQAVPRQLGIEVAQIHDYQQQPGVEFPSTAGIGANARTAAALLEKGLQLGAAPLLRVGIDLTDDSPRLVSLNFRNPANYDFHLESTDGKANATGQLRWDPVYGGLINGNPRTAENSAVCHESVNDFHHTGREDYLRTRGNPARIEISARNKLSPWLQARLPEARAAKVALFEIMVEDRDISNRSMADFVKELQADERLHGPVLHSLFTLDARALGSATFPRGARFYTQLQTHFSKADPAYTMQRQHLTASTACLRDNDLPRPANALGAFGQSLRVKHSINATAWNAMKSVLNIP